RVGQDRRSRIDRYLRRRVVRRRARLAWGASMPWNLGGGPGGPSGDPSSYRERNGNREQRTGSTAAFPHSWRLHPALQQLAHTLQLASHLDRRLKAIRRLLRKRSLHERIEKLLMHDTV